MRSEEAILKCFPHDYSVCTKNSLVSKLCLLHHRCK